MAHTSPADGVLIEAVRRALAAAGDPDVAVQQQAYMKSAMPYFGLAAPRAQAPSCGRCCATGARPTARSGRRRCATLWDERHAPRGAVRRHRGRPAPRGHATWLDPAVARPLCRHLVVTGAWWDLVDDVATHLVGDVLRGHRRAVDRRWSAAWATDDDLWLRRTAVICQVGHRGRHRPRPAPRTPSSQRRRPVVLAAQGDRLGAAPPRPVRPRLGPRRGRCGSATGCPGCPRREALKHLPS